MILKLFYFDKNKQKIIQKLETLECFFWKLRYGFLFDFYQDEIFLSNCNFKFGL